MSFLDDVHDTDAPAPPVSSTPRARIGAALDELAGDELEVLALIAERFVRGRDTYGQLELTTDRRDFRREALEEAADGLVYVAAALMRARGGGTLVGGPGAFAGLGAAPEAERGVRGGW